jgi:agmatinase
MGTMATHWTGHFPYTHHGARFLDVPALNDQAFGVAGIPFDGAVTNRPGARFGPGAIRQASHMLCDGGHPYFNVSPCGFLGDAGDMRLPNASPLVQVRELIEQQAHALMSRHHMVFLGGDHSVTLALLRAAHRLHGPLALVHFDAHCDTWTDHFGEPSGHGTWTYEAIAQGLVKPSQVVQVGIRSSGDKAARDYVATQGGLIFDGRSQRGKDGDALQPHIDQVLQRIGDTPCYLTIDIDCLDPAFAPGTGTPEPGGLSSGQLLTWLEGLSVLNTVAMDCVEVAPAYDHAELTSNVAATAVWTYLCGQVAKRPAN